MNFSIKILIAILLCTAPLLYGATSKGASDLSPVEQLKVNNHAPLLLVDDGKAKATISYMTPPLPAINLAVTELVDAIAQTTGVNIPVAKGKITKPGIVILEQAQAVELGLVDKPPLSVEGFVVRSTADALYIIGRDNHQEGSYGSAWGIYDVLERLVGVRWYWPAEHGGRTVVSTRTLSIQPVAYQDSPVFRQRDIWPTTGPLKGLHGALRSNNSWPINLIVHAPRWGRVPGWVDQYPESMQMRANGDRDDMMICYSHPKTLALHLKEISRVFDDGEKVDANRIAIRGKAITVSPWDAEVRCYCEYCKPKYEPHMGNGGDASKLMAEFVSALGVAVKQQWPDATIIYLPYLNYTLAPQGVTFPDNVEVQICGMPGMAMYKEPKLWEAEFENLRAWKRISGRPVQTWHYNCWPEDRTAAPYHYPNVVNRYYRQAQEENLLIGTFINGTSDHWPRQHISQVIWMKSMWNPHFSVEAVLSNFCQRMFGPASSTMRQLVDLQIKGWEDSRWKEATLSPGAIYGKSYPPITFARMRQLLTTARAQVGEDPLLNKRLDYYEAPFAEFEKEYKLIVEGAGIRPLVAKKVGENPKIDGKLDESLWQRASALGFQKFDPKNQTPVSPVFPTEVRAVWTGEGISLGFTMTEPRAESLKKDNLTRDDGTLYWQDCVEIMLEPTGVNTGKPYHLILTAGGASFEAKGHDTTWNPRGLKFASSTGNGKWFMEVLISYTDMPDAKPGATGTQWMVQLCRNRMADRTFPDGTKGNENQKLNANFGGFNSNPSDFAILRFEE